jgi:hypothetical protein
MYVYKNFIYSLSDYLTVGFSNLRTVNIWGLAQSLPWEAVACTEGV